MVLIISESSGDAFTSPSVFSTATQKRHRLDSELQGKMRKVRVVLPALPSTAVQEVRNQWKSALCDVIKGTNSSIIYLLIPLTG